MEVRALPISGAWLCTPRQFTDDRGVFLEWFRADKLAAATGHRLTVAQANHSLSRRGTLRGIHFADVPPGQAKYVYCAAGAVLDVVVDLRTGSPTYGDWHAERLDASDRRGLYLAEGLGHAFLALSDRATLVYLCSTPYAPEREHEVHPLDPGIGIEWPVEGDPLLSAKDAGAPTLEEARTAALLPAYAECQAFYRRHRTGGQ
ncbi:MAG: dTDP-4-dehydrorhamnose 3,5-epimerase [Mycobacteriales bacterium]